MQAGEKLVVIADDLECGETCCRLATGSVGPGWPVLVLGLAMEGYLGPSSSILSQLGKSCNACQLKRSLETRCWEEEPAVPLAFLFPLTVPHT